jgi:hypothetical protein
MKLLDIGQGLFINPEYIVKIEKSKVSVGERLVYTIEIYLANLGYRSVLSSSQNSVEKLSFESVEKRDDYFLYLFRYINGELIES